MTEPTFSINLTFSELTNLNWNDLAVVLSLLPKSEKINLFGYLKKTQKLLPITGNLHYGFELVEKPEGWQVQVLGIDNKGENFRKVSSKFYGTQTDAHNAFELFLVTWIKNP